MASPLRISLMILSLALAWGAAEAHAQGASDKAAAEALFDRGLLLMKEGRFAEACERLEQSQSIERGIGTMLYLAECYEKIGKTASAWAIFREAASWAQAEGQSERADAGKRRAEKLEKDLSRLAVQVPSANKLEGLRISDNGSVLQPSVYGLALPVDPGVHRVEAKAPGYLPWSSEVKVGAHADSVEVRVPLLEKDPNAAVAAAPVAPSAAATASAAMEPSPAPAAARPEADSGMSGQKITGITLGALGVASIIAGAIVGGLAIKHNNDAEDDLDDNGDCSTSDCESLSDKAVKEARASTITWAAGAALLAGGLLTYFLEPKQKRADIGLQLDRQTAGLRVGGVF
jgi:tetratricopeptide (TPR) repeat protein